MKRSVILLVIVFFLFTIFSFIYAQMMHGRHMRMMHNQNQGKWVAPSLADKLTNPTTKNSATINAGKNLFQTNCVVCHGSRGKGDGSAGAALNPSRQTLRLHLLRVKPTELFIGKLLPAIRPCLPTSKFSPTSSVGNWLTISENFRKGNS